jgi:hypothetical protein
MTEQKFKHISVGKDGSVWAVGKTDTTIFRLYGDAGIVGWAPNKTGKAEVTAAIDLGNANCVNKDHEIWFGQNGTWSQLATKWT